MTKRAVQGVIKVATCANYVSVPKQSDALIKLASMCNNIQCTYNTN